jgi:hypothetical protein
MRSKGTRLGVERLEDRWLPANVRDVAGILLVTNPQGPLTVTVSANAGQVIVADSSGTGTFGNVGALVSITGTNGADSITFQGGAGFRGNVIINSLSGDDTINVSGPIGGNLTLLSGMGNTTTNLSSTIGGALTYHHGSGPNTLHVVGATTVSKGASLSGLGSLVRSAPFTVNGSFAISGNPNTGTPLLGTDVGNLTVNGSLYLTGGRSPSSFTVTGLLQITGNLGINFILSRSGLLDLHAVKPDSFIQGDLVYSGGAGSDTVLLGANLAVGGDALLSLGSGAATYTSSAGDLIEGSLYLTVGNFNNKINMGGDITGDASLTVGNGNNTITVNNAPAGQFYFFGGNGTNTITLGTTAEQTFEVYLRLGTGKNVVTLTATDTLDGTIIGGGFASDTLNQNGATLLDVYFQDFPGGL